MKRVILPIYAQSIPKVIHSFCGKVIKLLWVVSIAAAMTSCATQPPKSPENLCAIFEEKRSWHKAAVKAEKRWGTPLQVPMAMMYQESGFRDDARPPRKYLMGFIPWGRQSSAYGYSQAKTGTWKDYKRETGRSWADRDDFADAIDFMSWFVFKTHQVNRVSKWDARHQYFNYHEGWGGYQRGTYKNKQWLIKVADRVNARASRYAAQYAKCKKKLNAGWLKRLFS